MPELTEEDKRAIHDIAALLLGVNGNPGLAKRVETFMYDADKRIRRLEIILGSVILVLGGSFGIVQLVG